MGKKIGDMTPQELYEDFRKHKPKEREARPAYNLTIAVIQGEETLTIEKLFENVGEYATPKTIRALMSLYTDRVLAEGREIGPEEFDGLCASLHYDRSRMRKYLGEQRGVVLSEKPTRESASRRNRNQTEGKNYMPSTHSVRLK